MAPTNRNRPLCVWCGKRNQGIRRRKLCATCHRIRAIRDDVPRYVRKGQPFQGSVFAPSVRA